MTSLQVSGIDVNGIDNNGSTPLHEFCRTFPEENDLDEKSNGELSSAFDALLAHPDIDVTLEDKVGHTALDIAYDKGVSKKIIDMLRAHPKSVEKREYVEDWENSQSRKKRRIAT